MRQDLPDILVGAMIGTWENNLLTLKLEINKRLQNKTLEQQWEFLQELGNFLKVKSDSVQLRHNIVFLERIERPVQESTEIVTSTEENNI